MSDQTAENALRESEERLRLAQQVAHIGTFEWNIQTGVNRWTPELEAIYGLPPGGFSGTQSAWEQLIHAEDRPEAVRKVQEAMEKGGFEGEWRVIWPNGAVRWLAGRAWVFKDEGGRPQRLIGVNIDITERKRLEQRLRATIESSPTAMVMIDRGGTIVLVNRETEKLFGYQRDELLGKQVEVLVPERFRPQHPSLRMNFLASPESRRMGAGRDLYGLRKDGSEFPVEIGLSPIEADEGPFVLSAIVDITERKRTAEQLQRYAAELERSNRELDQFAYSASHDLRAPLRAIEQLARWMVEDHAGELPQALRGDLDLMQRRVRRMQRLLDDLLQYARVGREGGDATTVDVGRLLGEIIDLLAPPEGFSVAVGPMPTIVTQRAPLEQVLRNLIGNAIKHHDRPDGHVEVSALEQADQVEFRVRDDGPGIAEKYHEQVFQMFQTLKPRDAVEGSGMGLALVKKILDSRGGRIRLDSTIGQGAAFHFTWPKSTEA